MRIAIIINKSWNIYNFRLGVIKAFQELGHEVLTIAPKDVYSELLEKEGCRFINVHIDDKGTNPLKDAGLFFRFLKIYHTEKPDLILNYTIKPNIYSAIAAKIKGIPTINNVTGLGTVFLRDKMIYRFAQSLYKFAFRFPYKVFFQNSDDRNLFIKKGFVRKDKTEILPGSGVNILKFKPNEAAPQNEIFTFLLIARLLFDKGIVEYVEAIKILKQKNYHIRFQLLGAMDETANLGIPKVLLNKWIDDGLVDYLGFTDNVLTIIQNADCVVLPSYREGLPRSLLEAMAVGKPVITTDVPGCRNVVKEGVNGYLCKLKDEEDLAAKMEKIISLDSNALNQMGEKSRELVKNNFDEKFVISKYLEAVNKVQTKI